MRKVGVAAIKHKRESATQYAVVGRSLEDNKIAFVREAFSNFKTKLGEFALKHRDRINKDPEFRMHFNAMCQNAGVDPLASSKGFWADLLGFGDFFYELGVVIVHICLKQRPANGGIIRFDELLRSSREHANFKSRSIHISAEDVKRAIEKLQVLGNGFQIVEMEGLSLVVSVPLELNKDHVEIFSIVHREMTRRGISLNDVYVSQTVLEEYGWSAQRFQTCIQVLIREGMSWVDVYEGKNSR